VSTEALFPLPEAPAAPTIAKLRAAVDAAQAAAVAALRKADDACCEDNGADDLAENFLRADDVQSNLLTWLREWQARDAACYDDEDNWEHPEGPLTENERAMMRVFETANDRLNDLRMAIYALRARELAELQEAGAVVTLTRGGVA
jgi:hypothetical protein